jgi:hypothetical protein
LSNIFTSHIHDVKYQSIALNTVVESANIPETAIPIAAVSTSALSAPEHQKCTQKELKALLHVARYGTKVQVRVREPVNRTSTDDLPGAQNISSGTASCTNQQQIDSSTRYKWRAGRICQITTDTVSVRFPNGIDIRVPWISRDVKLFRHTPLYQPRNSPYIVEENKSHDQQNIDDYSTPGESNYLNWNNDCSRSRVEPESSSAAADFLLQNFDSDSDDERYSGTGGDNQNGRVAGSLTASFEQGKFSELTDHDGEVEIGLELCGIEGMGGMEGRSGRHEGLLGLESLLMQYQGERGDEVGEKESEFLGNLVRGSVGGSVGICLDQGPAKKRIVSFASSSSTTENGNHVDADYIEYVAGHDLIAEQAKELEEIERKEAVCRQQDEDDYFRRLNIHSKNDTTKILPGSYTFDYTEQKEKIESRRTLALLGAHNPEDEEEEEEEEGMDLTREIERAGLSLDPEEDPTIPVPPPDACVYGRLGKVSVGILCCGDHRQDG